MAVEMDADLPERLKPKFEDVMCSLLAGGKLPGGLVKEYEEGMELGRRFSRTVVRPYALELDRKVQEDPDYLPWELVEEINRWGFYTGWIPKMFGGKGWSFAAMAPVMEEVASECLGIANVMGVHYFGLSFLFVSWNMRLIDRICREVVEGERTGKPCLVSGAITEPGAGTDVEEVGLLSRARVKCHAEKVDGGYMVNGNKVFISNGHLSTWHMLVAYEDLERPDESMIMLAVKNGTAGFSFGRMERKMGQKGCPASELVFEDCFVPDENVCICRDDVKYVKRSVKEANMQLIDFVVSMTRPGVGTMATGVARGACQEALAFALETEVGGRPLIEHEWAQCMLAEMHKNVALARLSAMECGHVNAIHGMTKMMNSRPVYYYNRYLPTSVFDSFMPANNRRDATTRLFRKLIMDGQKDEDTRLTSGWASLSKFAATDLGIRNCHMAVELMGQAGIRQDRRAEKCLRDSKLLQIYEGTNQLNRLNLFKCLIARDLPDVRVFEE